MTLSGAQVTCHACGTSMPASTELCPSCGVPQGTERTTVRASLGDGPSPLSQPIPAQAPLLGGKWRLGRQLGKGGMGAVYLAHDEELDRPVAIKMLAENLCDDAELVQRFEREARMMAKLDHPNLVPVYAVGRHENVPFIVMKMLEGLTLHDTMKEKGAFELSEVLAVTRQICAGLQFVHERQVVHRDIKPANIFIAPDGHVTLLDLGVARESTSNMTRSGVMVGTPRYMAPEQVLGKKVDHKADLYALATVVYEMVTGRAVFQADSDFSVMKAHIDEAPVNPLEFADLPQSVANALLKGLAKDPQERFASAKDFLQAMEQTVAEEAPSTKPGKSVIRPLNVTVPPKTATPRPQGRPSKGLATPLPVKGHTGAGAQRPVETRYEGAGAEREADDITDEKPADSLVARKAMQRNPLGLYVGLGFAVLIVGSVGYALLTKGDDPGQPHKPPVGKPTEPAHVSGPEPTPDKPSSDTPAPDPVPTHVAAVDPRAQAPGPNAAVTPPGPKPEDPRAGHSTDKPAVPDKPVAAVRTGPAQLRCTTTVGGEMASAYVDVDGIRKGATPLVLKLDPGKHQLVFRRSGAPPLTRELTVSAGENRKLTVEMPP